MCQGNQIYTYDADNTHASDVGVINIFNTTGENRPVQSFTEIGAGRFLVAHSAVGTSSTIYEYQLPVMGASVTNPVSNLAYFNLNQAFAQRIVHASQYSG